jgi:hypothetical protein
MAMSSKTGRSEFQTRPLGVKTGQCPIPHIIPHIVKFVKPGSKINTDEGSNFKLLKERFGYDHEMVDHSKNTCVAMFTRTRLKRFGRT